jgi:hypothetical protein
MRASEEEGNEVKGAAEAGAEKDRRGGGAGTEVAAEVVDIWPGSDGLGCKDKELIFI